MKKTGIVGIFSNPARRLSSHNAGYTLVLQSIFKADVLTEKDDWNQYDELIISEGVNYRENIFNIFGGIQDKFFIKLDKLNNFLGQTFCVNIPIDYNVVINKRKELKGLHCNKIPTLIKIDRINDKLILGDSHCLSVYKPGYSISRHDGKTLNGFLNIGLKNYIHQDVNDLIFYAGNIDIRFHIHRFYNENTIKDITNKLFEQLNELNIDNITLVDLLPIEDESRELPGTGLYKGKKFYGSKEQRTQYVKEFNRLLKIGCEKYGYNLIQWDFDYEKGLSFDDMESRRSVHLRPTSYKYIKQLLK